MSTEKTRLVLDVIMLLVVIVSMIISIRSCKISDNAEKTAQNAVKTSKESNQIANEALDISKYQFIQVNRPYVLVEPAKYANGQFWKITQEGTVIKVNLKYKISNVGNIAAKDIDLPDKLIIGFKTKIKKGAPVLFRKMGKVTLGPGDDFNAEVEATMGYENIEKAKKNLEQLVSDKSEGLTFQISVEYTNELDDSQRYRTFMMNRIHNEKAQLIKSEMLNISGELEQAKK